MKKKTLFFFLFNLKAVRFVFFFSRLGGLIFGIYAICPVGKIGSELKDLRGLFGVIVDFRDAMVLCRFARLSSEKLPRFRHEPMFCLQNAIILFDYFK